ncbi:hypothetical protein PAMP_006221 [Pampus punctatissimus]
MRGSFTHWCPKPVQYCVISTALKLPVDLGHVTGVVVASRDWVFRPRLVRFGFSPDVGGAALGLAAAPLGSGRREEQGHLQRASVIISEDVEKEREGIKE